MNEIEAARFIQMQDGLGVSARAIIVALRQQRRAQAFVIVDFAVVSDPYAPVFARHGNVTGGRQVDDRQTAIA